MVSTNDFKNGMTIIFNGQVHQIVEFQHVKPGKGHAFVRTRLRNLRTGQMMENIFKSKEEVEQAIIERRIVQYLYRDGDNLVFMDVNSFEQIEVPAKKCEGLMAYLKPNGEATATMYDGEVIDATLPFTVELKVTEAAPGAKGDTATGATKVVQVETGAMVTVPLFINTGDVIKIDTRTGDYLTRA